MGPSPPGETPHQRLRQLNSQISSTKSKIRRMDREQGPYAKGKGALFVRLEQLYDKKANINANLDLAVAAGRHAAIRARSRSPHQTEHRLNMDLDSIIRHEHAGSSSRQARESKSCQGPPESPFPALNGPARPRATRSRTTPTGPC